MSENNENQILENQYINNSFLSVLSDGKMDKNELDEINNELSENNSELLENKIMNIENKLMNIENKIENKIIETPKTEITLKTKEDLISHIKEWIKIDKEINICKSELKEKIALKKLLSSNLIDVMKNNKIDCFDINGGSLVYKKGKSKENY